ncbi:hypothetical protein C1T31_01070 [Hanstruepera neustonica]|uniref:Uncharacterized protein n=1 Tax=Hanstruepera neustonica TaxID=1445657 RepID=A0A2K1E3A4_9FLAO|nr:hypothetical protein C1T31_01070 [Hanstruepera neustonica]
MDYLNIVLGLLLIALGFFVIKYYQEKLSEQGGLTFKIRTTGIGLIIIGLALILEEFNLL